MARYYLVPARAAAIAVVMTWALIGQAAAEYAPHESPTGQVVSAHPLASQIGRDVLQAGGSAADAAVATALALAVVEPYSSGLGGGGFALHFDPESKAARALDFRETAPAAASRDMYLRDGQAAPALSRTGALSVAVPGLVAGLVALHEAHGTLPFAQLVAPARALAESGFEVDPRLHRRIRANLKSDRFNEAARDIFAPGGEALPVGAILVQTDLAQTLRRIEELGAAGFYEGPTADGIVETVAAGGGLITLKDLEAYEPIWRNPIRGTYRGRTLYSMPPPSSGGVHLVQMLNVLEGYPVGEWGFGSAATVHAMTESMRTAYADRAEFLGDPDFADVPVERLTSKTYAESIRAAIPLDTARKSDQLSDAPAAPPAGTDTTHLSVLAPDGSAVSSTLTINLSFGSGWVAAGTGIVLNDEMDDFSAQPGTPNAFGLIGNEANAIAPRKRPLSSMTPTLVTADDRIELVVGAPGGSRIITTVLQLIVNVIDHSMDIAAAQRAPRIHHQWKPDQLFFERHGLSPDTRTMLEKMGHRLRAVGPICNAQAIQVNREEGTVLGASDPRGIGQPAGL